MLAQVAQLSQRNRASLRYISHRRNFEVLSTEPVALPQAGLWASCCNIPFHFSHFTLPPLHLFLFFCRTAPGGGRPSDHANQHGPRDSACTLLSFIPTIPVHRTITRYLVPKSDNDRIKLIVKSVGDNMLISHTGFYSNYRYRYRNAKNLSLFLIISFLTVFGF